jgi:hypothetical protein
MSSVDNSEARQALLTETRKDLLARQLSNSVQYDRAILSLSTGALGISLAFIKNIVPVSTVTHLGLLKGSWCLFGSAIILTVISFLVSQHAIKVQLLYAQAYYSDQKEEYRNKPNRYAGVTDYINYISGLCFVLAIIFTIVFVSINLGEDRTMANDKDSKVTSKYGATIPTMQPVQSTDIILKGAPVPTMQPVPATAPATESTRPSESGSQSSTTGTDNNKQK